MAHEKSVRTCAENAVLKLFHDPRNVEEFLALVGAPEAELLDFPRMRTSASSYVTDEFRKRETDIVLEVPVRPDVVSDTRSVEIGGLTLFILVEHQSRHDAWMFLRASDYGIQILNTQRSQHPERTKLFPVLPIVLHTGKKRWRKLNPLADRIVLGPRFERHLPEVEPILVSLAGISRETLRDKGGLMGIVLGLLPERRERPRLFWKAAETVVRDLRDTQTPERQRLVRLFHWLEIFCYNARLHEERDDLRDKIDTMIPDDIREEVIEMGKTMAEHDREVTRLEHSRSTLLRQLQRRFGEIPEGLVTIIEATKDQARLDGWLDRFATADRLEDVGIG
jgi:putative YhgA-like transposase